MIIEDKVKQIISETFKVRRNDITMEMTAEDIELWDSLGQLILISNLEKEFNVIYSSDGLPVSGEMGARCLDLWAIQAKATPRDTE